MKILLGDFNAKVRRDNIFKPTIGNESLHQDINDNVVRLVNFATSKNLVVKRPLGRPRRRWEDNTKIYLQEVGGGCGDWMELAQDRNRWRALVSTMRNLRVPKMRGIS